MGRVFLDDAILAGRSLEIPATRGDVGPTDQNLPAIKKCLLVGEIDHDFRSASGCRVIIPRGKDRMVRGQARQRRHGAMSSNANVVRQIGATGAAQDNCPGEENCAVGRESHHRHRDCSVRPWFAQRRCDYRRRTLSGFPRGSCQPFRSSRRSFSRPKAETGGYKFEPSSGLTRMMSEHRNDLQVARCGGSPTFTSVSIGVAWKTGRALPGSQSRDP